MKKVIFLYSVSGLMERPWLDAGYEVHSFDGQFEGHTQEGNWHKHGRWFYPDNLEGQANEIKDIVGDGVCLVFGFPPCDDLAVSGAAWFAAKREKDPDFQVKAVNRAKLVAILGELLDCPWALENPVSVLSTKWRVPDFSFHPFEYGGYLPVDDVHPSYPEYIKPRDAYPKKTCIWCGNGFSIPQKIPVEVELGYSEQYRKLGGKSLRTKNIRSATPRGFAKAVFTSHHIGD